MSGTEAHDRYPTCLQNLIVDVPEGRPESIEPPRQDVTGPDAKE